MMSAKYDTPPKKKGRLVLGGTESTAEQLKEVAAAPSPAASADDFPSNQHKEKPHEVEKKEEEADMSSLQHSNDEMHPKRTRSAKRRSVEWFFDSTIMDHGVASVVMPFCDTDSLMRLRLVTKRLASDTTKELVNQALRRLPLSVSILDRQRRRMQVTLSLVSDDGSTTLHDRKGVLDHVVKQCWLKNHHESIRRTTTRCLERQNIVRFRHQSQTTIFSLSSRFEFATNVPHREAKKEVPPMNYLDESSDEDKARLRDLRITCCILLKNCSQISKWQWLSKGSTRIVDVGLKEVMEGIGGISLTMPGDREECIELKVQHMSCKYATTTQSV